MPFLREFAKQQKKAKISPEDIKLVDNKILSTLNTIGKAEKEVKDFHSLMERNRDSFEGMYGQIDKAMRQAIEGMETAYREINDMEFLVRAI